MISKAVIVLLVAVGTIAQVQPGTCKECVVLGRVWQLDRCNPSNVCLVADVGCYTSVEACKTYDLEVSASKLCTSALNSCLECTQANIMCAWSAADNSCFNGANYWGPTDAIAQSPEQCPATPITARPFTERSCTTREIWSPEKVEFCCTNFQLGCPAPQLKQLEPQIALPFVSPLASFGQVEAPPENGGMVAPPEILVPPPPAPVAEAPCPSRIPQEFVLTRGKKCAQITGGVVVPAKCTPKSLRFSFTSSKEGAKQLLRVVDDSSGSQKCLGQGFKLVSCGAVNTFIVKNMKQGQFQLSLFNGKCATLAKPTATKLSVSTCDAKKAKQNFRLIPVEQW